MELAGIGSRFHYVLMARTGSVIGCQLAKKGRYVSIAASCHAGNTTNIKTQRYLLMYRRVSKKGRN